MSAAPVVARTHDRVGLIDRLLNSRIFLGTALLAPALLVLAFVFAYPVLRTMVMAFQSVNLTRPADAHRSSGWPITCG